MHLVLASLGSTEHAEKDTTVLEKCRESVYLLKITQEKSFWKEGTKAFLLDHGQVLILQSAAGPCTLKQKQ